jgi:hypothetical protein
MIHRTHRFGGLIHSDALLNQPLSFLGLRFTLRNNVQSTTTYAPGTPGSVAVLDTVRGAVGGGVCGLFALAGEYT